MTNHAHDLIQALTHLDADVAKTIENYRPRSLDADQIGWWLDDIRLFVASTPPTDRADATGMLSAACQFLTGSGADSTKPTGAWFTDARIQAWLAAELATGRRDETVRKFRYRLEYVRRAAAGAPGRRQATPKSTGRAGRTDSELADIERALAEFPDDLGAWVALAGAGLKPCDLQGTTFTTTADGFAAVDRNGRRFPVLDEFAHLAPKLARLTIEAHGARQMANRLRADAIDARTLDATYTFYARALDGRAPVSEVMGRIGTSPERAATAAKTVLAAPAPAIDPELLRGGGIAPTGNPGTLPSNPTVSGATGSPRLTHMSKAAIRRMQEEALARSTATPVVSPALEARLKGYQPAGVSEATWAAVEPSLRAILARAGLPNDEVILKSRGVLAGFLLFRLQEGEPLDFRRSCTVAAVDAYFQRGMAAFSEQTRSDYRSRLDRLVRAVNPGVDAPPKIKGRHQKVRAGYSALEEAQMRRIASRQPDQEVGRQACAIVGLCCGAGLSASDLKDLHVRGIVDHGDDGIEVIVTGPQARRTWVRREYDDLVRASIVGLSKNRRVMGNGQSGRNVVNETLRRLKYVEEGLLFEAARMRTTWLAWLVTQPISLRTILDVSGLQSARTLAEIIEVLPTVAPVDSAALLRGDAQ